MDTDALYQQGRARFEHAAARRLLKEKYQAKLIFGWKGGMWRAGPEMITLLNLYGGETIVVQDLYETPVRVDANELCDIMRQHWQEQMNAWLLEYEQIANQR